MLPSGKCARSTDPGAAGRLAGPGKDRGVRPCARGAQEQALQRSPGESCHPAVTLDVAGTRGEAAGTARTRDSLPGTVPTSGAGSRARPTASQLCAGAASLQVAHRCQGVALSAPDPSLPPPRFLTGTPMGDGEAPPTTSPGRRQGGPGRLATPESGFLLRSCTRYSEVGARVSSVWRLGHLLNVPAVPGGRDPPPRVSARDVWRCRLRCRWLSPWVTAGRGVCAHPLPRARITSTPE